MFLFLKTCVFQFFKGIFFNPLNAHAAKAKLTLQPMSCKQSQSDKILVRRTLNLLSVLLTNKALFFKKRVGSTTFENREDIM